MGSGFSTRAWNSSTISDDGDSRIPVILNVYDLTTWNNFSYWCGLGIFHSGIEGGCAGNDGNLSC